MERDVLVVGGGAAGMMAAVAAAQAGASVCLLERNEKLGRKLYITGKGRCNLTNHCPAQEVLEHTPRNARFLYGAMTRTDPAWVEEFFTGLGVELKVERGGRVFPASDKAADVIDALFHRLRRLGVEIFRGRAQELILEDGCVRGVVTQEGERIDCKALILATGGVSYPATGSTGDGYQMARQAGHTVVPPVPSLVPLETEEDFCREMQGLSLKNVRLRVKNQKGKTVYEEQGEMLFTHFGVSGPLVLSASAHLRDLESQRYRASVDLKPALSQEMLEQRLLREFSQQANRDFQNILGSLVPRMMVPVMLERSGIPPERKGHDVTRQERRRLLELLKDFSFTITAARPISEAIITSGGVKVGEVDPKTMASRKIQGLFFAGELLDVDAYTGGFNLQIAWATGRAAGEGAAAHTAG